MSDAEAEQAAPAAVIDVHLQDNEYVEIQTNPLPEASQVLEVLTDETDMKHFVRLAVQYHRENRPHERDQFFKLCQDQTSRPCEKKATRQALLVALASRALCQIYTSASEGTPDINTGRGAALIEEAQRLLQEAEKHDSNFLPVWILRGAIYLETGNYEQAEIQFQTIQTKVGDSVPALVGLALSFMRRGRSTAGTHSNGLSSGAGGQGSTSSAANSRRGDIRKALRFWQLALRNVSGNPNYPMWVQSTVRLGLGNCFAQLGFYKEARLAFTRVLDISPKHATAMSYLSTLCLNEMRRPECSMSERRQLHAAGVNYAQKAFRTIKAQPDDIGSPLVLTRLADLLFLEGRQSEVPRVLERAFKETKDPLLLAELHYYRGRNAHYAQDYEAARTDYAKALSLHPEFTLARYPLAQLHAHQAEISEAIEHLDAIRESVRPRSKARVPLNPDGTPSLATGPGTALGDDYDTLRLLAFLHARLAENPIHSSATMPTREYEEARERTRQLYSRALDLFRMLYTFRSPDPEETGARDFHALLMHARLMETSPMATSESRRSALELYSRAEARLVRDRPKDPIPPEIVNNQAVVHHLAGQLTNAKSLYLKAFELIRENTGLSSDTRDALETTVRYNFGRASEDSGEFAEADKAYHALLKVHPTYIDAWLRLGFAAQQAGHLEDAAKHFQMALDREPNSVETHILFGALQVAQNQVRGAKRTFETVLTKIDKFDIVSLLHLGNLWLHMPPIDSENLAKNLLEAYKMFDRVLSLDPRNPYAANGLAMALRLKGWPDDALRFFEQVREADDTVPCFAVNYAHMLAEVGQFKRAIPLYERALERYFNGNNVEIMVSAARAHYQLGKQSKNAEMLMQAVRLLQQALHFEPSDLNLWFNLAIVIQDHTAVMSSERMDKVTVKDMRESAKLAELAIRNLNWLVAQPGYDYDEHIVEQRVAYIRSVKEKLEKRIDELVQTQADRQKRLQDMIQQREMEERQKQERERTVHESKRREMDDVLKTFEEMNAKIQEGMRLWDDVRRARPLGASNGSSGGGGGGRRRTDDDGFLVPDSESDGEGGGDYDVAAASYDGGRDIRNSGNMDGDNPLLARKKSRDGPKRQRRSPTGSGGGESDGDANDSSMPKRRRLKKRADSSRGVQPISNEFIEDSDEELMNS